MKRSEVETLRAKKRHLDEWLHRYMEATDVLPYVQMQSALADWALQALSDLPAEAETLPPPTDLGTVHERDFGYLSAALPLIPEYDRNALLNSTALTTSGTAIVYQYITTVGDIGSPPAIAYASRLTRLYRDIQGSQDRLKAVHALVIRLNNPQTAARLDRASQAYVTAKTQTGGKTAAALEMRTFLDGIQGDLIQLAQKWPRENMTWNMMAQRLAKGSSLGTEYEEIVRQHAVRSHLIDRLSTIAKDREGGLVEAVEDIWAQVLDHAYTVLSLVQID